MDGDKKKKKNCGLRGNKKADLFIHTFLASSDLI